MNKNALILVGFLVVAGMVMVSGCATIGREFVPRH
jgi:hypothetical protein